MDSADNTKIFYSSDKGDNWSQIDVDPSDSSGDNESRDHNIQTAWHDRTNKIIYFADLETFGLANSFDVWKLDYSASESSPTTTEIATYSGDWIQALDIFIYGGDLLMRGFEASDNGAFPALGAEWSTLMLWTINGAAARTIAAPIDNNEADNVISAYPGMVETQTWLFVPKDVNYEFIFWGETGGYPANTLHIWGLDPVTGFAFFEDETIVNGSAPNLEHQFMSYDDSDVIYYPVDISGTNYLYSYSFDDEIITQLGEYNIVLMLDRNTVSGVLEKGFHLTEYKVYQLHSVLPYQLHLIAEIDSGEAIVGITDNFLITGPTGKMFEYEDISNHVIGCIIHRQDMTIPSATFDLLNEYDIVKGMFIRIEDTFISANVNLIYKATYNFKDEADGTSGTDIDFVDAATLYNGACEIVSDWQSHRKVLRLLDDATPGEDPIFYHNETQAIAGTREFWIGTSDVTAYWEFYTFEGGVGYINRLRIVASNMYYFDGAAWNVITAVSNDIIYHVRIVWRADNTQDIYVNGVLEADNVSTDDNMVSGVDRFYIKATGDSTAYLYLDAYGDPDNDEDYNIGDNLTVVGGDINQIIFEGYVDSFKEGRAKIAKLFSPADELYNIKPNGEYSGRSDQIIVSLIGDYCKYITVGTLSAGGAMGTITFYGDKTMFKIINELALFDNFIFALRPEGELDYNNGTVDTKVDFTLTSHISNVKKLEGKRAINDVLIKGAIVNGVQVTSDGSHVNQTDIDTNGRNPYERTHSHLNTNALCNTTAASILARLGIQALISEFSHNDASIGLMQESETITLEYTGADFSISSDQFGIRESIYDAVFGKGFYRVSDRII